MENKDLQHILFKKDWVNHFVDSDGKQVKLPDRFIAKDKDLNDILIVTYSFKGGSAGHGMGMIEGFEMTASRFGDSGTDLINEDERIRKEGFWVPGTMEITRYA